MKHSWFKLPHQQVKLIIYVRRAAYTQLIKQFLLLLVQGKPLFKHRGYRFNKNVEPFNTYYPLY